VFPFTGILLAVEAPAPAFRPCPGSPYIATMTGLTGFGHYRSNVYLWDADGSVALMIDDGVSYDPSLSSDARVLAYTRGRHVDAGDSAAPGEELLVRNLRSSPRSDRVVARSLALFRPDLSADGSEVAVESGAPPTPASEPAPVRPPQPLPAAIEGTDPTPLSELPPPNKVYVLSSRNGAVTARIDAPAGSYREDQADPDFSPDGQQIAYASSSISSSRVSTRAIRVADVGELSRRPASGRMPSGRVVLELSPLDSVWSVNWTPDGRAIAVTVAGAGRYRTVLVSPDGRRLAQAATEPGKDVLSSLGTELRPLDVTGNLALNRPYRPDVPACAVRSDR
jgi:Tol biopolymer transport system component